MRRLKYGLGADWINSHLQYLNESLPFPWWWSSRVQNRENGLRTRNGTIWIHIRTLEIIALFSSGFEHYKCCCYVKSDCTGFGRNEKRSLLAIPLVPLPVAWHWTAGSGLKEKGGVLMSINCVCCKSTYPKLLKTHCCRPVDNMSKLGIWHVEKKHQNRDKM